MTGERDALYQVLARRKRPQSFGELVGQEVVSKALSAMIESGRIPHAFLFTGTRGTGKTSSARILAKSLCCEKGPTAEPCQTCVFCRQITTCSHDDVLEIDGASNTGVDSVRELRESARFFPNSARYKVYIIDEVHMLSIGAFNALLKTLEEPPPQVVFVLATTELHKVPMTVRSRCMVLSFRKIAWTVIADHLKKILAEEGIPFEDNAVALVAREAKGSLRDSLSLLEQVVAFCGRGAVTFELAKEALGILGQDLARRVFQSIVAGDSGGALEAIRHADSMSVDLGALLEDTASLFRNALVVHGVQSPEAAGRLVELLPDEIASLRADVAHLSEAGLSEVFRLLMAASREAGRARSALPWAEVAVLDAINRAAWLGAGELVGLLSGGGESPARKVVVPMKAAPPVAAAREIPPSHAKDPSPPPPPPAGVRAPVPAAAHAPQSGASAGNEADLANFRAVIEKVSEKSPRLAGKLRCIVFERFNAEVISFSDTPENRVYSRISDKDAELLREAIVACGFGKARISGIALPGLEPAREVGAVQKKNLNPVQPSPLPGSERPVQAVPPVRAAGVSVGERDAEERRIRWEQKRAALLERPELSPLKHLSDRVDVVPLENPEELHG